MYRITCTPGVWEPIVFMLDLSKGPEQILIMIIAYWGFDGSRCVRVFVHKCVYQCVYVWMSVCVWTIMNNSCVKTMRLCVTEKDTQSMPKFYKNSVYLHLEFEAVNRCWHLFHPHSSIYLRIGCGIAFPCH